MNRLLHSNFKNRLRHKLQNITSLKLIILILTALWLWPAAVAANSGSDNDPARRNAAHDVNRSAPQNVQPAQPTRSSNRDMTFTPSSHPSRTFSSPQPVFTPPSATAGSRGTIQSRSDTQPPAFNPPATIRRVEVPKFELTADAPKSTNNPSDNSDQRTNTDQRSIRQDIRQRIQGSTQGANSSGGGQTNQSTRSSGTSRDTITTPAPGTKTFTLPSGSGDNFRSSDAIRRLQDRGQVIKTPGANQTDQKVLPGTSADKSTATTSGGTGSSATDKNVIQPKDLQSGNRPSISDVRTRLSDQGLEKGKLSGNTGDKTSGDKINTEKLIEGNKLNTDKLIEGKGEKSNAATSKTGYATETISPLTPKNPVNEKLIDNVKQRLGTDNKGGKYNPADLKLNKNLETSPLKSKVGEIAPGLTTKQLPIPRPISGTTKIDRDVMLNSRFPDRLKSGELDKVAKGDIAQKVKLSDQFKLMQQGDVARRLELHNHPDAVVHVKDLHAADIQHLNNVVKLHSAIDYYTARPQFYHGTLASMYINNCFKYAYFGPTFFAGPCWYPYWNPWVAWSWYYHCHPIWDPRPFWSRPVIYDPYYDWAYWQTPVWVTLPVVDCGTWVDVQRPVLDVAQNDLQLLAVRFVDPGHPQEKLGPRYRVWFRNNGETPIEKPFNVMLFAGNDDKLSADLPRNGVRVKAIEAGDTQSVDIRLPIEATAMWRDAEGKAAPFQVLHVLVDANREIVDINPANNGAAIQRDEILPVDPAAFEVDPAKLSAGGEMVLAGEGLGPQPGQVLVNVGGRELQAEILGWYDLGVRINVPKVEISNPTPADVIVIRGDGAATNPVKITLLPSQPGPALTPPPPPPAPAE